MSFYPLINDTEQLLKLDKWLLSTILNVLRLRREILKEKVIDFDYQQFPYNNNKKQLLINCKTMVVGGRKGLMEIPSFLRIYDAIKLGLINEGIEKVMNPQSGYYE